MSARLRQYEVENNPETKPAREHWEKASAGAETDEERQEWARLKGLVESGGAMEYWDQARPILERRLETIQESFGDQIEQQAAVVDATKALADEVEAVSDLQVTESPTEADNEHEENQ